jgi:hypothetical protein
MADRVLTWHIAGTLSNNVQGTNVSTEYVLDDDYLPVRVILRQKVAQSGDATLVDINDDGTSIFRVQPAVNQGLLSAEWNVFDSALTVMNKDSVITLDIDQVSSTTPGEDLTVQLELEKVQ